MKIPKILHQTWKDKNVPEVFQAFAETWKKSHPDWKYVLWTDIENHDFVKTYFPDFLSRYENYPTAIQKVDAVRYLVLYKYGGVFVDLDFECFQNLEPLFADGDCYFGEEPLEHSLIHQKAKVITNAFMATVPQHRFFDSLYNELLCCSSNATDANERVLETTGPFMLTRVYDQMGAPENVRIITPETIYPLTKNELISIADTPHITPTIRKKLEKAFALHYYAGTWWKKQPLDDIGRVPFDPMQ